MRALLAVAALLVSVSAAEAQTGTSKTDENVVEPATVTASPEAKRNYRQSTTGDPNRQICRTQSATGSRLSGTKICKTAREWEEQRVASKQEIDRMQTNRGLVSN